MGGGTYNPQQFKAYANTASTRSQQQNFTQRGLSPDMNPLNLKVRESRDNVDHPASNAVAICFDVTGSMGSLANDMASKHLPKMVEKILSEDRNALPDAQVCFMAQGDGYSDSVPFQIGQFESDITMTKWLEKIYIEGNGGGNGGESYWLAYYAAAYKMAADCWEKRQKKGFLFTIGDEPPHRKIEPTHVKAIFGDTIEPGMDFKDLIQVTRQTWQPFHILVSQYGQVDQHSLARWKEVMGENVLPLDNSNNIAELIVSTIELIHGKDLAATAGSWSGSTAASVSKALVGLSSSMGMTSTKAWGLARL